MTLDVQFIITLYACQQLFKAFGTVAEAAAHEVVHVMTMVVPAGVFRAQCDVELVEPPGGEHVGRQSLPVLIEACHYAVPSSSDRSRGNLRDPFDMLSNNVPRRLG